MFVNRLMVTLLLVAASMSTAIAQTISPQMQEKAAQLAGEALADDLAYRLVESLTTEVGPRLAGTEAEKRARQWAVRKLSALGFANVRVEPFELPVWVRGLEEAAITAPFPQPLVIAALGAVHPPAPTALKAKSRRLPVLRISPLHRYRRCRAKSFSSTRL